MKHKVVIKAQSCGCKDFKELRVAFGNMENCQLKCPFCFTLEQKKADDFLSNLRHRITDDTRTIRFTGGEPLISQDQINGMIKELNKIERKEFPNLDLIVIQTNAIKVEQKDLAHFNIQEFPLLFEVSLKGTNISEYKYLTFDHPISDEKAKSILNQQMTGYGHLVNIFERFQNINVLARLGIFHSSLNKPTFKFVYPFDQNHLMFNPEQWAPQIYDLFEDQRRIWGSRFDGKMVIERLKNPGQGSPGMGKRYRRIIEHLKSKNVLLEDRGKTSLPQIFKDKYCYKNGDLIYQLALKSLV